MFFETLRRHPVTHLVAVCLAVPLLLWTDAHADVLVLFNGDRIPGTLANRDVLRHDPYDQIHISFLIENPGSKPELLDFHADEIEYVILEDDAEKQVIDFHMMKKQILALPRTPENPPVAPLREPSVDPLPEPETTTDPQTGLAMPPKPEKSPKQLRLEGGALVLLGFGLTLLTLSSPFGEETVETPHGPRVEERHNAINWALLAGGVSILMSGASSVKRANEIEKASYSVQPIEAGATLTRRWRF